MILQLLLACGPCGGDELNDLGAWNDVVLPEHSYVCTARVDPNKRITVRSRSSTDVLESDLSQSLAAAGWTRLGPFPGEDKASYVRDRYKTRVLYRMSGKEAHAEMQIEDYYTPTLDYPNWEQELEAARAVEAHLLGVELSPGQDRACPKDLDPIGVIDVRMLRDNGIPRPTLGTFNTNAAGLGPIPAGLAENAGYHQERYEYMEALVSGRPIGLAQPHEVVQPQVFEEGFTDGLVVATLAIVSDGEVICQADFRAHSSDVVEAAPAEMEAAVLHDLRSNAHASSEATLAAMLGR